MQTTDPHAAPVPFAQALRFWLKLGCISFGGPAGQIALMHRELVEQRRWISESRFAHALNYCMLLPGPEAQQLATYIGWLLHRTWGGVAAGVLFVLPSLLLLIGLSAVYVAYGDVSWVAGFFYGIQPAVAALVLQAVHRLGAKILGPIRRTPLLWALALGSFAAVHLGGVAFPWVVLCAALLGALGARWAPDQFAPAARHVPAPAQPSRAGAWPGLPPTRWVIGDDTPPPPHARFRRARLLAVLAAGLALWAAPMTALVLWQGWGGTLAQMGLFFTQAALLTFGGAYAVLPYVVQGAVTHFGWLTSAQMMDGLALGETTPGPLIMVVAFVGFLGGYSQQVLGPQHLWLGATLAAVVVTWFTFLPSFIFILAGGPLVEQTRGQLRLTAPLTAISAAVVGVIASLAVFFIVHIAVDAKAGAGFDSTLNVPALLLALFAAVALMRWKWGVVSVLALCGLAGVLLRL